METKNRHLTEFSICSVIFCLIVVFIHVSSEAVTLYNKQSVIYIIVLSLWRLSSFVVQGFIFLSGLKLFLKSGGFSYKRFYISRLKRVVIPYIVVFCLFYLYFVINNNGDNLLNPAVFMHYMIFGDLTAHFYFVTVICQFYLLIPLWRYITDKLSFAIVIIPSLVIMLIFSQYLPEILRVVFGFDSFKYNGRLFTSYLFYFIFGCFCGRYYTHFIDMLKKQRKAVFVTWLVTAFLNCVFIYWNSTGRYYAAWLDSFHVIYCFLSILLSVSLSLKLTDILGFAKNPDSVNWCQKCLQKFCMLIDKASYYVYLVHPMFIIFIDKAIRAINIQSISLRYLLRFIFTYALVLGLCAVYNLCTKKRLSRKT